MTSQHEAALSAKNLELNTLRDYASMLENVIVNIQDRLAHNTTELARLINIEPHCTTLQANNSVVINACSQVISSIVQLPEQDSINTCKPLVTATPSKSIKTNNPHTLNINTVVHGRNLDMTRLSPYYTPSLINSNNNPSLAFVEELQRLGDKYNKIVCSLENLDASPLAAPEPPKNCLKNEQFQNFVKALADRIKDRYEDNLSQKVFGE